MLADKIRTLVFGFLFLFMIACSDASETEQRQEAGKPPVVQEMSRSAAFMDYAASTNMLQTELASIAISRGESEEVKALAEQVLAFYQDAQAGLLRVARAEGMDHSIPDSLGTADQGMLEEFRKLPAEEFDAHYREYISSSHRSQLERYQEMLLLAEEEEIRNWVNEMQLQLRARQQLGGQYDSTLEQ